MNVYIIKTIEPKKKKGDRMSLRQNIRCLLKRASRSVINCTKIEFQCRQQIEEYSRLITT